MDLEKIGKFISELRKEHGLTQEQLGEKLGVTNKTVSRWETGTYLPPADALMRMSELFCITINELLSGKRLESSEYQAAAEKNLKAAIQTSCFDLQEKTDFYKKKWLKEHIALMLLMGAIVIAFFATGLLLEKSLFITFALLLVVLFHMIRNNRMMTYVESHAYDGGGSD